MDIAVAGIGGAFIKEDSAVGVGVGELIAVGGRNGVLSCFILFFL